MSRTPAASFNGASHEAEDRTRQSLCECGDGQVSQGGPQNLCSIEQRDKLLKECPRDDLRFVLFCGFHLGLRRNEIVEARPQWFNLSTKLATVMILENDDAEARELDPFLPKGAKERSIPLSKAFTEFLTGWLDPRWDYCLDPDGRRGLSVYRYDPRRPFEEYVAAQKLPWVTFHTMRRTFGSIAATKGASLYHIANWLGDDYRTTADHYAHLIPQSYSVGSGARIAGGIRRDPFAPLRL